MGDTISVEWIVPSISQFKCLDIYDEIAMMSRCWPRLIKSKNEDSVAWLLHTTGTLVTSQTDFGPALSGLRGSC